MTSAQSQSANSAARSRPLVVLGTSLGGLDALGAVLAGLPRDFAFPLVVVQHRCATPDPGLARALGRWGHDVKEVDDKEPIIDNRVHLAPPDYHLLVESDCFSLSTDDFVSWARPSIDILFESAAEAFGAGVIAVVLIGANHDGSAGARHVRGRGGRVVVQDPATAECPVMPAAAIETAGADWVLPVERIPAILCDLAHRERR